MAICCDAVRSCRWVLKFRGKILPPFSALKIKAVCSCKMVGVYLHLHTALHATSKLRGIIKPFKTSGNYMCHLL
jgi:hypothetical protein